MNRAVEPERAQRHEPGDRILLARQQLQFGADPGSADRAERATPDRRGRQRQRVGLDLEAQAARVPHEAKQPRGIVDEAPVVQHAEAAVFEVLQSVRGGGQLPVDERDRDRVDREVAALEILGQRRGLNLGQRSRMGVRLAARLRDVIDEPVQQHGRRPEPIVPGERPAERPRVSICIALDDQVEVDRRLAQQQVPYRATHQIDTIR